MKKLSMLTIILFSMIICSSCSDRLETKTESHQESLTIIESPIIYNNGSQEFEIHYYFKEYRKFIEQAKREDNEQRRKELFNDLVLKSVIEDGTGVSNAMGLLTTPSNIDELEKSINSLVNDFELIQSSIEGALKESSDLLPGGNKKIYVLPSLPKDKDIMEDVNFVAGYAYKSAMIILIDPEFGIQHLKHTVAHEYHHTIYMEMKGAMWYTLLEKSILEGKADTFARVLYPDLAVPWASPLEGSKRNSTWHLFKEYKNQTSFETCSQFFNGDRKEGIPKWSLYRIGNEIMINYLEKYPDATVEEWTKMKAEELFEKSGLNTDT